MWMAQLQGNFSGFLNPVSKPLRIGESGVFFWPRPVDLHPPLTNATETP
jgi:hypothetical protein